MNRFTLLLGLTAWLSCWTAGQGRFVQATGHASYAAQASALVASALSVPALADPGDGNEGAAAPLSGTAYSLRKVVIDAGHGGHDHGCSGKHSKEKHLALAMALKVGAYIEQHLPDVEVIYTRKTDVFVELHERAAMANRANADAFLSIHCNANSSTTPYGTETFVMGLHRNDSNLEVAKRENEVILMEDNHNAHYEGFDPSSPNSHIIFSLYQSAYLEQSIELAGRIEKQFSERVGRKSRGVKQAGFLVLYKTAMPAVLIETGFLTNPKEEDFLASEQGMDLMASAIFRAFRDYKVSVDNRATAGNRSAPPASQGEPASASAGTAKPAQAKPAETKPATTPTAEIKPTQNKPSQAPSAESGAAGAAPAKASPAPEPAAESSPATVYRVQIYASSRKLESADPLFAPLKGEPVYRVAAGKLFRYSVGEFSSIHEASARKAELRRAGFPDAFVVAQDRPALASEVPADTEP
jgi:N-acetylmuramoyl-L-alanine amidase